MPEPDRTWWKEGTVYQIYPSSFADSNGDGVGDIPGIISKLDYIRNLGVDIIWICPHYESPQVDMGYDISNYEKTYPLYGTNKDCELLIEKCHDLGMKILFDLVINHTSDQHPWFQESLQSMDSPKHDWYIWQPPKYDENHNRKPPNNWKSYFGGSAWEWVEHRQEYYLHLFAKEQPDLNWENEETRKAIYATAIEFWLKKGIDGFRIDMVGVYSKPQSFPDAPITVPNSPYQKAHTLFCNGPRIHEYLSEMKSVLKKHNPDAFFVGELPHTPDISTILEYVGKSKNRLDMVFDFDLCAIDQGKPDRYDLRPWSVNELKIAVSKTQKLIMGTDAWTSIFLENHDTGRSISRYGSDSEIWREKSGKLLALMLATLSGTLFIYQGEEIGMVNIPGDWGIEELKCVEGRRYIESIKAKFPGDAAKLEKALDGLRVLGRDNARTPMQWDDSPNAGFSKGKPWMRVNDNYAHVNVATQQHQSSSLLGFWKSLLKLRKSPECRDLLIHGDFYINSFPNDVYSTGAGKLAEEVFLYLKKSPGKERGRRWIWVVLNFSDLEKVWDKQCICDVERGDWSLSVLYGNYPKTERKRGALGPWEGRLYLCVVNGGV